MVCGAVHCSWHGSIADLLGCSFSCHLVGVRCWVEQSVHGTHLLGISEWGGVCDFLCFLLECIFLFWSAPLDQNKRLEKRQPALTHEPWAVQSPSITQMG